MDSPRSLISNGILYGFNLNGNHWQNLHWNPVKFIKAAPGTSLSQTFVDISYGLKHRDPNVKNATDKVLWWKLPQRQAPSSLILAVLERLNNISAVTVVFPSYARF